MIRLAFYTMILRLLVDLQLDQSKILPMKIRFYFILFLINTSLNAQVVKLDSSNLPICIIDTRGQTINNEPKILVHMKIIYNGPGKMNHVKDKTYNYNNFIAIEIRGNSSQFYPQKQYGLELRDSVTGADLDASLMGMPEEEDWVLYAPYNDISMLRNVLAYNLWNEMGHWGPHTRFCELILNNEYVGVYILMESIKRGPTRLDISKLKPEDTTGLDVTGGYIMKIDKKNSPSDLSFTSKVKSTSNENIEWLYHYPDSNDIVPAQQNYIHNYIDTLEQLIASTGFADPKKGYKKYLSVNSFIDYFLITEFSRNIDAYKASSFFYKEKLEADGSKGMFKAGPVWDYNFAFGNAGFCSGGQTNGWMYDGCVPATLPTPILWRRLLADTNYVNAVKCRYLELRKTIWDTNYLIQYLNHYAFDTLDSAQKRHFTKWKILGTNPGGFNAYIASSYSNEMLRLRNWIKARLSWMDANLPGRCIPTPVIAKIEIPLDPECFIGTRPLMQKTQPFKRAPFNYSGSEKINNIPSDIIRWVLVELRDAKDSSIAVERRAALLRNDSVLVDTNYQVGVLFPKAINGQRYFLLIRYDSLSFLMSNEAVELPNDNDYNLNRDHRVLHTSNSSPVIYNTNSISTDTFQLCENHSLILNDSNLIKLGYSFSLHQISTNHPDFKILNDHEIDFGFDSSGFYQIPLYLNCNNHSIIRSMINVRVLPNPEVEIISPDALCVGDSIELHSGVFKTYKWSTGDQSEFIVIHQPGIYKLSVSDDNGCTAEVMKEIIQHPEIKGKIASVPSSTPNSCKLYFVSDDSLQAYTYFWSNGETKDTIETSKIIVTLIVTDSNRCHQSFFYLCNPLVISNESLVQYEIIPNPNEGNFRIVSSAHIQSLRIYSVTGTLVLSIPEIDDINLPYQVSIHNLTPGIYYGIANLNGKLAGFKIVVQ